MTLFLTCTSSLHIASHALKRKFRNVFLVFTIKMTFEPSLTFSVFPHYVFLKVNGVWPYTDASLDDDDDAAM